MPCYAIPYTDPLAELQIAIRQHHAFDTAAQRYVDSVIAWRQSLGSFNRVGTNLGFHIVNYTMYLHFAGKTGGTEHGATYSALLNICERRQQCSGRALRTVLAVLGVLGHLHTERSVSDGRIRIFVPSYRLVRVATDIYGYAMAVLDELVPGSGFAEAIKREPEFLWQIISKSGRAIVEDDVRITEHFPELDAIISRAGGLPTSISIAGAEMRGELFPAFGDLAKKFKISASQVRTVVTALDESGLIVRGSDGTILSAQPLVEAHKGLIARELALHANYALSLKEHLMGLTEEA